MQGGRRCVARRTVSVSTVWQIVVSSAHGSSWSQCQKKKEEEEGEDEDEDGDEAADEDEDEDENEDDFWFPPCPALGEITHP